MKKPYESPELSVELFRVESIMDSSEIPSQTNPAPGTGSEEEIINNINGFDEIFDPDHAEDWWSTH